MTAERRAAATASGIATALLAGRWRRREAVRRVAEALGHARAPRWVGALVAEVLLTYRDAPADRPRELAAYAETTEGWARGQGRSVRTAAAPHAGAAVVLGMDLEAFFASVPAGRVWGLLQGTVELTEPVAYALTGLATTVVPAAVWRRVPVPEDADGRDRHRRLGRRLAVPHLPQGAPTSPALANLVCARLDRRLAGLAAASGAVYTRYVDDLTFSGPRSLRPDRLAARVAAIAAEEGFRVHPGKTRTARSGRRQQVLGAVVNVRPTLPREERDALRALLHNCAVRGWASQVRGHDPAGFRDHVLGRVAWASSVDPVLGERLRTLAARIDWS